jgi:hypothetical protein
MIHPTDANGPAGHPAQSGEQKAEGLVSFDWSDPKNSLIFSI